MAALGVAAVLAPGGAARTAHSKAYVGTFHCSQDFHAFTHFNMHAGTSFDFEVEHSFARVRLEVFRRVKKNKWTRVWGWDQPENWIVGKYHIEADSAAYNEDYAAELWTLPGSTGSCTAHVFIATP
jgi:hypothetical protein